MSVQLAALMLQEKWLEQFTMKWYVCHMTTGCVIQIMLWNWLDTVPTVFC